MKAITLVIPLYLFLVTSLPAGTIGADPTTGTPALISGNGGLTLGWEFDVTNTNGIVVDGLGFWDHQANGFLSSQTFEVGLWEPSSGNLLRSTIVTSASTLVSSLHPDGDWRVNAVAPVYLPPGLYRIGALFPVVGANGTISSGGNPQVAADINLVRYLRELGSVTLAMPDEVTTGDLFGPSFTFTPGPLVTNPTNLFYITSSPTSWIGQGQTLAFTTNISATRFSNLLRFSAGGYQLEVIGAGSSLPTVGFYPGGTRYPFNGSGVGLNFSGAGRGNNTLSGWFNVLQADFQTNGQPAAIALDFVQYDETFLTDWNRGSIRFNSAIPVPGAPPPIQITKFVRTNGVVQFTLTGPADTNCIIQVSSNLTSWLPLTTNAISPVGLVAVSDPGAVGAARRYYRAVATSSGGGGGGGSNDQFVNRKVIPSAGAIVTGSNTNATKEAGEPDHGGEPGGKSVWWTWTAAGGGLVSISLDGSSFDTTLGVYQGTSVGSLVSIAQDDEGGAGHASRVVFAVAPGATYQIAVDGYFGDSGNIVLRVKPGLLNDAFADRLQMTGTYDEVVGNNGGATYENNEPFHWPNTGVKSVWWTWQAPASGNVTFSTAGSSFDTIMAAYTGSSLLGLSLVANNDDFGTSVTSQITFFATAGTVYQIAVDGYGTASGSIKLVLQQ